MALILRFDHNVNYCIVHAIAYNSTHSYCVISILGDYAVAAIT